MSEASRQRELQRQAQDAPEWAQRQIFITALEKGEVSALIAAEHFPPPARYTAFKKLEELRGRRGPKGQGWVRHIWGPECARCHASPPGVLCADCLWLRDQVWARLNDKEMLALCAFLGAVDAVNAENGLKDGEAD